jgi:hypothetical protein
VATQILVEPMIHQRRRFEAHTFPPGSYDNDSILRVNNVIVPTGRLGAFLGYRTATLNGTLRVTDTAPLDRIAVYDINPGAAVITGGDINTFDVFNNLTVAGGPGIQVGRDLNWLNVGGNISITDGSEFVVGRDIGLMAQPPKGTDPGGQGAIVDGNLIIGPGSRFRIGRRLSATFLVFGNVQGSSRLIIPSGAGNFVSVGGFVP